MMKPGTPLADLYHITRARLVKAALLGADLLGQRAPFGLTLPIGLMTGVLGGAYLLRVLLRHGPAPTG